MELAQIFCGGLLQDDDRNIGLQLYEIHDITFNELESRSGISHGCMLLFYYAIEVLGQAEVFQQQSACLIIVIFLRTLYALEIKSLRLYQMNFTSHKFA